MSVTLESHGTVPSHPPWATTPSLSFCVATLFTSVLCQRACEKARYHRRRRRLEDAYKSAEIPKQFIFSFVSISIFYKQSYQLLFTSSFASLDHD